MIFDLSTMHLGDVLMALPAMRYGDLVIARAQHRVPGAPVGFIDPDGAPIHGRIYPAPRRGRHSTDAWLESTGRSAVRHRLMPGHGTRSGIVIAPAVNAEGKKWHGWHELQEALPTAALVDGRVPRHEWMQALNDADTVICPDTGTAHMADALGVPRVVVLHGVPANWPHCAPFWDRRYCIARSSMDEISVADVLEVVNG